MAASIKKRCERLVEQVQASPGASEGAVFHRAFDFVADPLAAIDVLAALGVSRIMTSGQCATAGEGAGNIARYIAHAAGRVEILPAAGIRPENVEALTPQPAVIKCMVRSARRLGRSVIIRQANPRPFDFHPIRPAKTRRVLPPAIGLCVRWWKNSAGTLI